MSKSPGRDRPGLTAANLHRRIEDNTKGKNVSYGDVQTDSSNRYPVKPDGKYKHDFENQYGPSSGPRATTVYSNNPLLNQMFMSPPEEWSQRIEGVNKNNPDNVTYLMENRYIPSGNYSNINLMPTDNSIATGKPNRGYLPSDRKFVAKVESEPFIRAEERREAAEYAKMSCWEKLMECLTPKNRKKNMQGGAGVTIKDLREFLDAHPDIKNILKNDECPLDPTEQMNDDADNFANMLENSVNPGITIDEIYNQDAGKRRKKTRKAKRRHRKTRKSKRQTKRRN